MVDLWQITKREIEKCPFASYVLKNLWISVVVVDRFGDERLAADLLHQRWCVSICDARDAGGEPEHHEQREAVATISPSVMRVAI